jgi:hypothetical protein
MPRRYPVRKAPPKPTEPPCPYCDGAYWRYNGQDWYSCDRVTKKHHLCDSPAAVEDRLRARYAPVLAARKSRSRYPRAATTAKVTLASVAVAAVGFWIYNGATDTSSNPGPPTTGGGSHVHTQAPKYDTPTAKCEDGSYSYAANHQGACSYHGGVAVWYR